MSPPRAKREALPWPEGWAAEAPALAEALVAWYRVAKRDLPWRHRQDPYAIWVSEAMLQQTQVVTAIPYFQRFLAAFPTLPDLAAAHPDALMKAWEGLGYYRRARFLQAAAQAVVAQHGGALPADPEALRALPGFGPYTAGAVAALAFGLPEPAVDGNVERVLTRLGALGEDPKSPAMKPLLEDLARSLYPGQGPSEVAQGLIELGALVCRPKAPNCLLCPLQGHCRALAEGRPEAYPNKAPARPPQALNWPAAWVRDAQGLTLLLQRPEGGVWGGLWTPPMVECPPGMDEAEHLLAFLKGHGLQPEGPLGEPLWRGQHRLTHRLLGLSLRPIQVAGAWPGEGAARWVAPGELAQWAMPKPFQAWAMGPSRGQSFGVGE